MIKTKKRSRLLAFVLVFASVFTMAFSLPRIDASAKSVGNIIESVDITKADGTVPSNNTYSRWATIRVTMTWAIPNGLVKNGDTATVHLPGEMSLTADIVASEIRDEDNNLVAHMTVRKATNVATITFTDYAESHSNVKGNLWFEARLAEVSTSGDYILKFEEENGLTFDIPVTINGSGVSPDANIHKYGTVDSTDRERIHWGSSVNIKALYVPGAKFIDTIAPGHELVPGSVKVYRTNFFWRDGQLTDTLQGEVTDQVDIATTSSGFAVDFKGNINEGYRITYDTRIVDGGAAKFYSNTATLLGLDEMKFEVKNRVEYSSGGGNGSGEVGALQLTKVSTSTGAPLQGAAFKLVKKSDGSTAATLTTDETGVATVRNLVYDDYQLIETKAPAGYVLDETPIDVTISDRITVKIEAKNAPIPKSPENPKFGALKITKVSSVTKATLQGAAFKLIKKSDGSTVATLTTDSKGMATAGNLPYGDYQLIETRAPKGYTIDKTPIDIKIAGTATVKLEVKNSPTPETPAPNTPAPATPDTGDRTQTQPFLLMFALGSMGLFVGIKALKKSYAKS